jgi:hypothetical protein
MSRRWIDCVDVGTLLYCAKAELPAVSTPSPTTNDENHTVLRNIVAILSLQSRTTSTAELISILRVASIADNQVATPAAVPTHSLKPARPDEYRPNNTLPA